MKIIIDTREQTPFDFGKFECEVVTDTLATGDYSLAGLEDRCAIERKSLDDLLGCLIGEGRERFERELVCAAGLECFTVVVEVSMQDMAGGNYPSRMKPHAASSRFWPFRSATTAPSFGPGAGSGRNTGSSTRFGPLSCGDENT